MTFNRRRTSRGSAHDNDFTGEDATAAFRRTDKMCETGPSTATEFGKGKRLKNIEKRYNRTKNKIEKQR